MDITGTSGHDSLPGTALADEFDLTQGGRDTVDGLDGDDTFLLGDEFSAFDEIRGGAGTDVLVLEGSYANAVIMTASTLVDVEEIDVLAGGDYTLTLDDANATGLFFYVDGHGLGAGEVLTVDASAETGAILDLEGGAGDDVLAVGYRGTFRLGRGGSDTCIGGSGVDSFIVEGQLDAGDSLDGGAGVDRVNIGGDYSAGLTVTGSMLHDIEAIDLSPLFDVDLTFTDDVIAAGVTFRFNAPSFTVFSVNDLVIDGSAESDGFWSFGGGISNDAYTGGALADQFDFATTNTGGQGGVDIAHGGDGDDVILFDEKLTRDDQADGGGGFDVLELDGDYSAGVAFRAASVSDVEQIVLAAGHSYRLTTANPTARADGFTVTGSALLAGETLFLDAGAESNSGLVLQGGLDADTLIAGGGDDSLSGVDGNDSLVGGDGDDTIFGAAGRDTLAGGLGADDLDGGAAATTFVFAGVAESTGPGFDDVGRLKPLKDHFDLDVAVSAVDARVSSGQLSLATFDADLGLAVDSTALAAGHAVVFNPDTGDLAGGHFLVVDANGADGYQAGADYVMQFDSGSHPNLLAAGFFV
jgi:Ca2+-binding RTX toxin-like protein